MSPFDAAEDDPVRVIAAAAGNSISGRLQSGMTVGVGWGLTLYNTLPFITGATRIFFVAVLLFFSLTIGDMGFLSVTLGMMQFVRGVDMRVIYTNPISISEQTFNGLFGSCKVGGVPSLLIWSVVIAVLGHVVQKYSEAGRAVFATGGNRLAAECSGDKTRRIKFAVFLLSGAAAVLAGMLYSGMMQTARFNFGEGAELMAIAALALGGTSLFGGKGSILGTFAGSLLIGTIINGLIIIGLDVSEQMMVSGGISTWPWPSARNRRPEAARPGRTPASGHQRGNLGAHCRLVAAG